MGKIDLKRAHVTKINKVQRRLPRDPRHVRRQGHVTLLRPGSRKHPASELRSLPPGPSQIRPTTADTPPYEGAPDNRRPHGAGHLRSVTRLTPRLSLVTRRVTDPSVAHTEAKGRASSRSYPSLHKRRPCPHPKTLRGHRGMIPNFTRLRIRLETINAMKL
jgi:hypothetical protein